MVFFTRGLLFGLLFSFVAQLGAHSTVNEYEEVVPYKFTTFLPTDFVIPQKIQFTTSRLRDGEPDLLYYLSQPKHVVTYPIVIVCGGSYERSRIYSIFHLFRYFYDEFMDLGLGILSAEEWGINGHEIDIDLFMEHYTQGRRFEDHQILMDHVIANPPEGWNGKFVLFGISEGAPLVTRLTQEYPEHLLATISWAGSSGWTWREEWWLKVQYELAHLSWFDWFVNVVSKWIPSASYIPTTRKEYDALMDYIQAHPTPHKEFMHMTYQYHADACAYPLPDYSKLKKVPFFNGVGGKDPIIEALDAFAERAKAAGCPITYVRPPYQDHFARKCPEIVSKTFEWLKHHLSVS